MPEYSKRHAAWHDKPATDTPILGVDIDAIEAALDKLLGKDTPAVDEVGVWSPGAGGLIYQKVDTNQLADSAVTNVKVSASAAIARSKLETLPYATSLPSSPFDGQETVLVDSLASPGYHWHLRYNAGSAGPKWEFLGGTPVYSEVANNEATASVTYVNLTTVGPEVTLPRPGLYSIDWGYHVLESGSGGGDAQAGLFKNGTVDIGAAAIMNVTGISGAHMCVSRRVTWGGAAAGDTVRLKYLITNSVSVTFSSRYLFITPIRLS